MMPRFESLPYRPCVGTVVFNRHGRVFIGRRIDGPEHVDKTHAWQLPQGGIDGGEDPWPAALRELYEETNIRSVEKLGEIEEDLCYDIPREIVGRAWGASTEGNARDGTRCVSPARTAKSTLRIPPVATSRNLSNGAGNGWRASSTWSCRSSGRFTSGS